MIFFILNDRCYSIVERGHKALYGRTPPYRTDPMDIAKVASALGADTLVVEHTGEILDAEILQEPHNRTLLIEVRIDPSVHMPENNRFESLRKSTQSDDDGFSADV